ncbi:MAG: dihydrofolate synthase [Naasia sp.]|jgi:dihydrofolate synthase/folylpolyglutamate synthase|uniref:bifunctional folylpolyglutamate synthase/dihydrofolate synthase n=1 Tax=Naasia sp. TaxID=2546198 RepID=UPI00262E0417|nr:folylpolyglutamate synthase/dihydrofolate synthase family protein [Naasia sp.]MCU1571740.1 dihydrofolate synthase [Naasia sp.]
MSDRDDATYDPDDPRFDPRYGGEPLESDAQARADEDAELLGSLAPRLGPDTPEFGPEPTELDRERADRVFAELLTRLGEGDPQPRLEPVRRAVELLGDPQRAHPVIHITGTNGKTSTSRIIESLLRAHGLRTGLLTSPHLTRFNERILIDGEPISDERLAANWRDIQPYLAMVDASLAEAGELRLTYFEALVVLGFAAFADAPVDVAVIEVGMGGEWDATNVVESQVAVFTPIALDHQARLGSTVAEIARTKSGIIKPLSEVVSAAQPGAALAELQRAAELTESRLVVEESGFSVTTAVAVGGQLVTIRGRAGTYADVFLPLYGEHQAHNAALAVAAVESFLGGGATPLEQELVVEGLATATSPGRLQLVGVEPTVLVDAAHNPHGAQSLAAALRTYFSFSPVIAVVGILDDKDAEGMFRALAPVVDEFVVTTAPSDRATDADDLAAIAVRVAGAERVRVEPSLRAALDAARDEASEHENGAVVVFGSITLVGHVLGIAEDEAWKP